jgi:hypothetical protein
MGLGCAVTWMSGVGQHPAAQKEINTLANPYMQPATGSQSMQTMKALPPMQPARPGQFMQPARPWQSMLPASPPFRSTQPASPSVGFQAQAMPGRPMPDMSSYGISPSPLSELAITAVDATKHPNRVRDVAMMASRLDKGTKAKLSKVGSAVALKVEDMAGITAPLGFFDPLGFTTSLSEGKLRFYREVELKHGRVSMLAALGMVVGEQYHPLFGGDIDAPAYVAFQQTPLETFWPAVVAAIAIPEIFSVYDFNPPEWVQTGETEFWSIRSDHTPGDLGFDPLGLKPTDPQEFKEMQTKELNNGRLAMIAAAGMIAQELVTGQKLF